MQHSKESKRRRRRRKKTWKRTTHLEIIEFSLAWVMWWLFTVFSRDYRFVSIARSTSFFLFLISISFSHFLSFPFSLLISNLAALKPNWLCLVETGYHDQQIVATKHNLESVKKFSRNLTLFNGNGESERDNLKKNLVCNDRPST